MDHTEIIFSKTYKRKTCIFQRIFFQNPQVFFWRIFFPRSTDRENRLLKDILSKNHRPWNWIFKEKFFRRPMDQKLGSFREDRLKTWVYQRIFYRRPLRKSGFLENIFKGLRLKTWILFKKLRLKGPRIESRYSPQKIFLNPLLRSHEEASKCFKKFTFLTFLWNSKNYSKFQHQISRKCLRKFILMGSCFWLLKLIF